jgi:DNA-3-methyladenine glycosylase I
VAVDHDRRLFEKLSLEGFQAGLSWLTILRKRENFRKAFKGFDIEVVPRFGAPGSTGCSPMPGSSATRP